MPEPSDFADERQRRRGLVYGRRKGPKLSAHQASLFQALLPSLALKLEPGRDPHSYFDAAIQDVWLEIGFGAGEHLLWQAEQHPKIGMMGCEPYEGGVAKLLSRIHAVGFARPVHTGEETTRNGVSGIRIYQGDGRDALATLPDASLGRVFLLFPDPWPKTRHHKRRFVQTETLDALARVLKPGAEFRFASDDEGYVSWTLERVLAHKSFGWTARCANDWRTRPADWPATRYEHKALHGQPVFLTFRRT